ncbi:hypothetical protein P7K49_025335 [Saguinus oedipus]|uniref:Uncharacterized protein n=1 Tax=Saguinus oedipus TaxID=9490 RepID=A0ABQ9UGX9_SAGOE|nr:hypothetical protein P7K49_025335 [Saguinus oedipus]
MYPELMVASYNNNEDAPHEPDGVALVWNMKFKKTTPEYVFHCQFYKMSLLLTASAAQCLTLHKVPANLKESSTCEDTKAFRQQKSLGTSREGYLTNEYKMSSAFSSHPLIPQLDSQKLLEKNCYMGTINPEEKHSKPLYSIFQRRLMDFYCLIHMYQSKKDDTLENRQYQLKQIML